MSPNQVIETTALAIMKRCDEIPDLTGHRVQSLGRVNDVEVSEMSAKLVIFSTSALEERHGALLLPSEQELSRRIEKDDEIRSRIKPT